MSCCARRAPLTREINKIVRVGIEFSAIPLAQQLGETGYRAQRLLQIMGGYVSELLSSALERARSAACRASASSARFVWLTSRAAANTSVMLPSREYTDAL